MLWDIERKYDEDGIWIHGNPLWAQFGKAYKIHQNSCSTCKSVEWKVYDPMWNDDPQLEDAPFEHIVTAQACPRCRKAHSVVLTKHQHEQDIRSPQQIPNLPAADRELLISGIDDVCWRSICPDE